MSDDFDYSPVPPKARRALECLPEGEIGQLRAEVERLRDLLAFNGINPNAQVLSAKGARFAYDRQEQGYVMTTQIDAAKVAGYAQE